MHSQHENTVNTDKRRITAHHHPTIQLHNMASQYSTQLHMAQFHRVQMSTGHIDDTEGNRWYRWPQMNTGMTDITSIDAHEQEHPQNTPKFLKTPSFHSI